MMKDLVPNFETTLLFKACVHNNIPVKTVGEEKVKHKASEN